MALGIVSILWVDLNPVESALCLVWCLSHCHASGHSFPGQPLFHLPWFRAGCDWWWLVSPGSLHSTFKLRECEPVGMTLPGRHQLLHFAPFCDSNMCGIFRSRVLTVVFWRVTKSIGNSLWGLKTGGPLLPNNSRRSNPFLALDFCFVILWCLVGTLLPY